MTMVERVARALAACEAGKITGPSRHKASDEFGWKLSGEHHEQYVEAHWREHVNAAYFAIEAMREPTTRMEEAINEHAGTIAPVYAWEAGIDAAINEEPAP